MPSGSNASKGGVGSGVVGFQPTTKGKTPPQSGPIMVGHAAMVPAEDSAMAAATRKMDAMHEAVGGEIQHKMRHRARKAFLVAAPIAIMIGSLTACGESPTTNQEQQVTQQVPSNNYNISETTVTLKDGRTLHCVYMQDKTLRGDTATGGPSCDWNAATYPVAPK